MVSLNLAASIPHKRLTMALNITSPCPRCGYPLAPQFVACPGCCWTLTPLVSPTSPQGINKMIKHTEIIHAGNVSLGNGPGGYNASFDQNGLASLDQIIRYTIILGHRISISSGPGRPNNECRVAYLPEIIGSGVSNFSSGPVGCSGVCIISPASPTWGHAFPTMDQFIAKHANGLSLTCQKCGGPSTLGHAFCFSCYSDLGGDWRSFL